MSFLCKIDFKESLKYILIVLLTSSNNSWNLQTWGKNSNLLTDYEQNSFFYFCQKKNRTCCENEEILKSDKSTYFIVLFYFLLRKRKKKKGNIRTRKSYYFLQLPFKIIIGYGKLRKISRKFVRLNEICHKFACLHRSLSASMEFIQSLKSLMTF